MKYAALLNKIIDIVLSERPGILADGYEDASSRSESVEIVVLATIKAMGRQVTTTGDVVEVAPDPVWREPGGSNANRRFGRKRR